MRPTVRILGTHGVPGRYGGFETAAENVALHLVARSWNVVVYCQVDHGVSIWEDEWRGIRRVNVPVPDRSWRGTSRFDLISIKHALRHRDLCLTFGYNTAVFNVLQRALRIPNVVNMDGIEWSRARWGRAKQALLWGNERVACVVADHLIADHPEIHAYLRSRADDGKISTITYGSATVRDADTAPVRALGLEPRAYFTLVARPIPENSILELVSGFSRRRRDARLVVLGDYAPEHDPYHAAVLAAASDEVVFPGAIFEPERVQALRFHSLGYLHGHTVGGTNPSLVEALGCGNPVIAQDNVYNRWVAGEAALYFSSADDVSAAVDTLMSTPDVAERMSVEARRRHAEEFTWEHVAGQYEDLLTTLLPARGRTSRRQRSQW